MVWNKSVTDGDWSVDRLAQHPSYCGSLPNRLSASHSTLVSKTLRSLRHFLLHSKSGRAPGCGHLVAFWNHFWRLQPRFIARSTVWRANPLSYIMWNTRSNVSSGKDLPWPPQQKLPVKQQQRITRNLLMDYGKKNGLEKQRKIPRLASVPVRKWRTLDVFIISGFRLRCPFKKIMEIENDSLQFVTFSL